MGGKRSVSLQMIAIGVAGGILNLVIVQSALAGLSRVDRAYGDVGRIVKAQAKFQDATSLMNALHGDVLIAVLNADQKVPGISRQANGGTRADARKLRADLDAAGAVQLPPALQSELKDVRQIQEDYVRLALNIDAEAAVDPQAGKRDLRGFTALFDKLGQRQAATTAGFAERARTVQDGAEVDEHQAQMRIVASAVIVLLGFLGLALVLGRLGRRLAAMAAREREVAETLQRSLLPAWLPPLPGVQLAARYVPGGLGAEVGGDWYDVIALTGGRVGLVMGDVVGHDLRAATIMGQMRHALHAYAVEGLSPSDVLQRLNYLSHQQHKADMTTCVYAVLDPIASTLTVANAGHYPPLVVTPGNNGPQVTFLEQVASPPIGAMRDARYNEVTYDLAQASKVVLYTDGLVERREGSVDEGLLQLHRVAARAPEGLEETCEHVLRGMLGDDTPKDDVALLVVEPTATLGDRLELIMPTDTAELVLLRRAIGRWLGEVGAGEDEAFEIMVACGEAATNAIEHAYVTGSASYQVTCQIDRTAGIVQIVVRDWGRWKQAPDTPGRGRGLHLIHALMDVTHVIRGDASSSGSSVHIRRRIAQPACDPTPPTPENELLGVGVRV